MGDSEGQTRRTITRRTPMEKIMDTIKELTDLVQRHCGQKQAVTKATKAANAALAELSQVQGMMESPTTNLIPSLTQVAVKVPKKKSRLDSVSCPGGRDAFNKFVNVYWTLLKQEGKAEGLGYTTILKMAGPVYKVLCRKLQVVGTQRNGEEGVPYDKEKLADIIREEGISLEVPEALRAEVEAALGKKKIKGLTRKKKVSIAEVQDNQRQGNQGQDNQGVNTQRVNTLVPQPNINTTQLRNLTKLGNALSGKKTRKAKNIQEVIRNFQTQLDEANKDQKNLKEGFTRMRTIAPQMSDVFNKQTQSLNQQIEMQSRLQESLDSLAQAATTLDKKKTATLRKTLTKAMKELQDSSKTIRKELTSLDDIMTKEPAPVTKSKTKTKIKTKTKAINQEQQQTRKRVVKKASNLLRNTRKANQGMTKVIQQLSSIPEMNTRTNNTKEIIAEPNVSIGRVNKGPSNVTTNNKTSNILINTNNKTMNMVNTKNKTTNGFSTTPSDEEILAKFPEEKGNLKYTTRNLGENGTLRVRIQNKNYFMSPDATLIEVDPETDSYGDTAGVWNPDENRIMPLDE